MAIPLPLLIGYALSAKVKGDRNRRAAEAEAKAEKAKAAQENMMGTLYQLPDGSMLPVADKSPFQIPEGAKPVKYGKLSGLSYDFPEAPTQAVPFYKLGNKTGKIESFSTEDQLSPEFAQVGTIKEGTPSFFPEHILGKGDDPASNAEPWWQLMDTSTNETWAGSPEASGEWLEGRDSKNVKGTRHIRTVKGDNVELTTGSDLDFSPKADPNSKAARKDVRITMDDGTTFFASGPRPDGFDPANIRMEETGEVNVSTGDFEPSAVEVYRPATDEGAGADDDTAKALNAAEIADMEVYLPYTPDGLSYIGIKSGSQKPDVKLRSIAQQLAIAPEAFKYMNENQGEEAVLNFGDAVYNIAAGMYSEIMPMGDDAIRKVNILKYPTLQAYLSDVSPTLLQIPGMSKRIAAYDESRQNELRATVEQNSTEPGVSATTAVIQTSPTATNDIPETVIVGIGIPEQYTSVVNSVIMPKLLNNATRGSGPNKTQQPEDTAKLLLRDNFVNYEKDAQGNLLKNENGNFIVSDDQPILQFFQELEAEGQTQTFMSMLNVGGVGQPTSSDFHVAAMRKFTTAVDNKPEKAAAIIQTLLPSGAGNEAALIRRYDFGTSVKDKQNFLAGQRDVAASSTRALGVVRNVISTYYRPGMPQTAENLLDSSAIANLSLFGQGMQYLAGKAADLAGIDVTSADSMFAVVRKARLGLRSREDFWDDSKESEGMEAIQADLKSIQDRVVSGEISKQYAQREFYTLVLAYEVAAAIQGGTGGRTISDQDVALIFRGLRQRWSDDPQTQVNALRAVENMMVNFNSRATALMGSPKQRAAWILAEDMIIKSGGNPDSIYNIDSVIETISDGRVSGAGSEDDSGEDDTYDADLLARINRSRQGIGEPTYSSLDEAKKDPMFQTIEANFKASRKKAN